MDRRIFPALTFLQDRMIVAFGDCTLQIDPRAMQSPGYAAAIFGFAFAECPGFALQFADEAGPLQREFVKQRFKFRVLDRFRRLTEPFLSVPQRFDEIINRPYDFFLLCHTSVSHAIRDSRSSLARRGRGRNFFYEYKRERPNERTAAQSENAGGRLRHSG